MFKERFIMAAGCALRIAECGSGERVVLLLHGYLESLEVWEEFASQLGRHARVFAIDIPGHGISEVKGEVHTMEFLADVVADVLRSCGVKKCTIVGHSMGGYVATAVAERHAQLLDGLVMFHSTPYADSEAKRADRGREIEIVEAGRKELMSRTIPGKGFAKENRKRLADVIEDLAEIVMLTEDEGIVALLRGMQSRTDKSEVMRNLQVPELFIFGRKDEYITAEVAEKIIAEQPQAKVAWLENSGHMGFIEEPENSLNALLDFLNIQD